MKEKKIVGYQVRNKHNDGIRFESFFLTACKENCPFGAAVWSLYSKAYGIKLRIFWMSPYRKIWYDKYSKVFNIFHLHIGCELLRRCVPLEIVYEPKDEPAKRE